MTFAVDLPRVVDLAADQVAWEVDDASTPAASRAWHASVSALICGSATSCLPLVMTVPTVWGEPRRTRLLSILGTLDRPIVLVPRAIAIARSHTDLACSACVVVEFGVSGCSIREANPLAHRLVRNVHGWELVTTLPLDLHSDSWPGGEYDDVAVILVDDPTASDALDWLRMHTGIGRILAVDTDLVVRYGADPGPAQGRLDVAEPWTEEAAAPAGRRRRRVLAGATIAAVIAATAIVGGVRSGHSLSAPESMRVGRVAVVIPSGWNRAEQSMGSGEVARAVFVRRDDGRRIIVVQTTVRAGSTPDSVARSLANKIAQRGDNAVVEFAPSMRMGGRDVIAYRETPASGVPIAWYVLVEHDLQVSIGCQGGSDAQAMHAECAAAVGSATID
ncbi:type VII secretion-associated protein [Gordonia sp. CPCC 205333]|uniref:type VII secretion-associated protein n=1 Tax=Gordonia sp. CPCC 205333 TaxID=3140790 RepID=UPI003AF34AF0